MNIRTLFATGFLAGSLALAAGFYAASAHADTPASEMTPEENAIALPLSYECLATALQERARHFRETGVDETTPEMYARAEVCMNEAAEQDPVLGPFLERQRRLEQQGRTSPPTEGNWTSPDPTTPPLPS